VHFISIRQVSYDAAALQRGRCGHWWLARRSAAAAASRHRCWYDAAMYAMGSGHLDDK